MVDKTWLDTLLRLLLALAVLSGCTSNVRDLRPWTGAQIEAGDRTVAEGRFDLAYDIFDSVVQYGDAAAGAIAISRIKADPRIVAGGPATIKRVFALNATELDAAAFENEQAFRAALMQRESAIGVVARYKAFVSHFDEGGIIHSVYPEEKVNNAPRLKAEAEKRAKADAEMARKTAAAAERRALFERLSRVQSEAAYVCGDKRQCDKAFALAQIYISGNADMKIQVATDTVIETFNPTEVGNLGMKVIRMPQTGESAAIILYVGCKESPDSDLCLRRQIRAYENFVPFVSKVQ